MSERGDAASSATMFDVAIEAGVSTATVSRVANNHSNIKNATRTRVTEAMDRLGYVPNLRARSLAGGRTNVLGLIVDDLESSYNNQVAQGIDETIAAHGYDLLLSTMHKRKRTTRHIESLLNGFAEGLIVLLSGGFGQYLGEVEARRFPVVLIDHDPVAQVPIVKADNDAGTRALVRHLESLGHRRIGFVTGNLEVASGRERLEAYKTETAALGLDQGKDLVVEGDFRIEGGVSAAHQLLALEDPPTAIFASSDAEAFGVMKVARERGLSIPNDLSVVGFDDIPEASNVTPRLTTVRQPMRAMGMLAAEMLMSAVEEGQPRTSTVELPTELIIRESTRAPADTA
ncbi:MAG: LacI family DNA-binding transcriptional regulator [Acidimicrobiia bacterium]